jgi:tRNA A-37 threonylcarbamoyl transferase component Bud32
MTRSPVADPRIGTELASYRIEAFLGRGGMSVVYLAEDLALGRKVALKLMAHELAEDRRFRERFRRESRLAASLDHPNVIPIYEAGEAEGLLYIAMRYVEGTDLRSLLAREGPLESQRALALLAQVAEALDAAHRRGLVHRDVKPSNVLLAGAGEREHVYLADFGLTKTAAGADEGLESVRLSGSPDYVAPEQITEGICGTAADIYSLGCVLFQCLTGQVPYPRRNEFAVLWAHVDEPPPRATELRPALPHELDTVVARALAKTPDERYATGRELVDAARVLLPETRRRMGRRRALVAAMLASLVAAALVAALLVTRDDGRSATEPTVAPASGALQRVDPSTNELAATIRLGGDPVDVAAGAGAVWLVDSGRNSLVRVDADSTGITTQGAGTGTLAAVATSPAFPSYVGIAADGPLGAVLSRIAPGDSSTVETTLLQNLPGRPGDPIPGVVSAIGAIAATASSGWAADPAAGTITRLSRQGQYPRIVVKTGGMPLDLASTRQELWVAQLNTPGGKDGGSVLRLDDTGKVTATVPLSFAPSAIAVGPEGVWVADPRGRRVWRVDLDGRRPRPVRLRGRPLDLAVGAGSVWVVTGEQGKVERVDARTLEVIATTEIGANPTALAVGEGGVWVAVEGGTPLSPASFPKRFRRQLYEIESIQPGRPGARCAEDLAVRDCLVVGLASVTAEDGTSGSIRMAMRERRRREGSVVCLGKRYNGPLISDVTGDVGTGRLAIPGWGTIALDVERSVLVASDKRGLCLAQSGTWLGVKGAIRGVAGSFETRGPGRILVFDS